IAAHSPAQPPRVPHDEPLSAVVIADSHHRVTTQNFFGWRRHWNHAGFRNRIALEALIHSKSKYERVAGGETSLHLAEHLRHPLVLQGFPKWSIRERRLWGLFREFRNVVGPVGLGTRAEAADALYAIADLRAAIGLHGSFHDAFVVVDE